MNTAIPATRYRIMPVDPRAHLFEVACTVERPDPSGQSFRLPTWVPGSYLVREFARHFVSVRAHSNGAEVPIVKVRKDTWRAAPCQDALTVIAEIYAFDQSVRTAYLDERRGYFNGAAVFLCPVGREAAACEVSIELPRLPGFEGWRVATTLAAIDAPPYGHGRYGARDYDELIDHPVELAELALARFSAGGVPHDIAVTGRHRGDLDRLARDLARVCQWQVQLFDPDTARAPFDRYLFQVMVVGEGYGGLEHRSSTSLICRRDELPVPGMDEVSDDYLTLLGLASHEYFHAWNVKRIKPAAFVPYDLSQEAYTRQLWAFEGTTSYYDDLALVRSGVIAPARYLEVIARTVTSVLRTPGRARQSVAESSFDAWIKFYRQDENSPNAVVSYYAKGALVSLALDLSLRLEVGRSLDDVMRALWREYGQTARGVPEDGFEAAVRTVAGRSFEPFFARYVYGTEDAPLDTLLPRFGVVLELRASQGATDRGGKAATGPAPLASIGAKVASDLRITHAFAGGAAERAGLAAGDLIVALDGLKATSDLLKALLARGPAGSTVRVHAFRRDELIEREVTLDAPALDTCVLRLDESPDTDALQRRKAWLGG